MGNLAAFSTGVAFPTQAAQRSVSRCPLRKRSSVTCCASATGNGYEVDEKGRRIFTLPMPAFEEPHPFGNAVSHEVNWEGYDFAEVDAKHQRERVEFPNLPMVPDANRWAIVTTPDVIQWRNNLFRLSRDQNYGYTYRMMEVGIACVPEFAVHEIYGAQDQLDSVELYTVSLSARNGNDNDWLTIEPAKDPAMKVLLCFEGEADALRLAEYLVAEGCDAQAAVSKVKDIRAEAKRIDIIIGLVPETTIIRASVKDAISAKL